MYPVSLGTLFSVSETTTAGFFTGATEYGRARATLGSGNVIRVSAKQRGTAANAYTVTLVNRGVAVTATTVRQVGAAFEVTLRRSSGALLATPSEVAGVINAAALPVRCAYTGAGAMVAVPATPLAGGLDDTPDTSGVKFARTRAGAEVGGFFYLENLDATVLLTKLACTFPAPGGTLPLVFEIVDLDAGLEPIAGTNIPFRHAEVSIAQPDYTLVDGDGVPLLPYQALRVTCAAVGTVSVTGRRLGRYPGV